MTKFAKISLAAAVAVAGLTSSASAVDLEKAIKGVDVSGYVRWRSEEKSGGSSTKSDLDIKVTAKIPVNDNVTAVTTFTAGNTDSVANVVNSGSNDETSTTNVTDISLTREYFSYVNGAFTVNVGRQDIPGRMVDASDPEGSGDGIVALYNGGSFVVGAAGFYNNGLVDGNDVASIIAMGTVGPVSLYGQWADVSDTGSFYNIGFDASIDVVKFGLEYTAEDPEANTSNDDLYTFKGYLGASVGIFSANLAYVQTGEDGNGIIDGGDSDAAAAWSLWQLDNTTTRWSKDLDLWALTAAVKATDKITLKAGYADGEYGSANTDVTEVMGEVGYKMSKNLNTYLRVSNLDDDTNKDDITRSRIEIKYSF